MTQQTPASSIIPTDLRCDYLIGPIGVGAAPPRLSWKLQPHAASQVQRGLAQSAYQIQVASTPALLANTPDLWDSTRVASTSAIAIPYAGKPLQAGERAWWTVRIWDQEGRESAPAPAAFWERGIAQDQWTGQWIGSHIVGGRKTEAPVPFLRRPFHLPAGKALASARLHATALGLYEFYLNGQRVGDLVFAPFWTDYRKRVQHQTYDVTPLLRPGAENVAGAILGDGWYSGFMGNIKHRQFYGDRPKLLAQLIITFTDGTTQTITTDKAWTCATGPILFSDLLMGEAYDARLEMPGWNAPGFPATAAWSPVALFPNPDIAIVPMTGPPVRAVKTIIPAEPTRVLNGWGKYDPHLFDMGQNMVGRVRLHIKGAAGDTVTMRFAEVLDDKGKLYTTNLRSAKQTDVYTLRGDPAGEVFESRFTFHGFRYVELSDYAGAVTRDTVTGIVLHSDMAETGTFECSDPLVNQLQHNIQWGQRGNFVDVPTDCPQRDERLGWTGDAQAFVRTAAFNFDVSGFFAKWTQDLRDAQGELGAYPSVAPNNEPVWREGDVERGADGGPAWADAGVICPWTMFLCYADRELLRAHYDSMARFLERLRSASQPFGLIRSHPAWKGWLGYGDWLSQDGKDGLFGLTPRDLIGTAFMAHDARLLSAIAATLGKPDDAQRYAALADAVAAAFCKRYATPDALIIPDNQTAYVLALHFNLLPKEQRAPAAQTLAAHIIANGNKLSTGFVGTPYLPHVLTKAGRLDVAYDLLVQKNWPSWLYAVTHGATTIWERWDGWTHDKGFQDAGMNSFNHYAYGAVGDWLYQVVAGIDVDPARPGYEHVIFHPHPLADGPLTSARAAIETIRGRVESEWAIGADARSLSYRVRIPPGATATVYVPAADAAAVRESGHPLADAPGVRIPPAAPDDQPGTLRLELASGTYQFTSRLPERQPPQAAR